MGRSLKVAVIGAGMSGLVAARELQRQSHRAVVFEKGGQLGGTWVYNPRVESDQLGVDSNRETVHSSLYLSLRTNLPRQLMEFSDYPFSVKECGDPRNFPRHEEVLRYINDFSKDFGITELIRLNTEVIRVELRNDQWIVESRTGTESTREEFFQAVVVCNGHYSEPRLANFPGVGKWPGNQVHSHNYRYPEPFRDQVVIVIGGGPSAKEISREIASLAKEVHLSSRASNVQFSKLDNRTNNLWQHSKILKAGEDGTVTFEDGSSVHADTILHCTGYKFNFPFLETNGIVSVEENRVGPLYKHVFPPKIAPYLSFVGIPDKGLGVVIRELQSKWIASVLSGKLTLPSEEDMLSSVQQQYQDMENNLIPKHLTHDLFAFEVGYEDWLATEVGLAMDPRPKEFFLRLIKCPRTENYRDELDIESIFKGL